jgi:hypothetical protein
MCYSDQGADWTTEESSFISRHTSTEAYLGSYLMGAGRNCPFRKMVGA